MEIIAGILDKAISEDLGSGDITSMAVIPEDTKFVGKLATREHMICAGLPLLPDIFSRFDPLIKCSILFEDGQTAEAGDVLSIIEGPAVALLSGERIAVNMIQHLSGIATLTREYVNEISDTNAILLDTRKTIPGLRELAKYATRVGGAQNHRFRLDDGVLIKDNHIAACGSITDAIKRTKEAGLKDVEVECDTLTQVEEALAAGADIILLDNMNAEECLAAVNLIDGSVPTEASGDINIQTIRSIAKTGVTYISVGKLTHSARAINIGLDWDLH
ncbi:MAG: nicotinate-nucleotide diphosphorylase (carboxylating) [Alphaproteobacteria bacterium]|nr:nicotinate-nucleotide diphosphorylase (carboxylating) [Alphaproteobacteria bacterium]